MAEVLLWTVVVASTDHIKKDKIQLYGKANTDWKYARRKICIA